MQVPLQLLDAAPVTLRLRRLSIAWLAQSADRVLLSSIKLARIQALLTAPGAPRGFIHRGGGDGRFQPGNGGQTAGIPPPAVTWAIAKVSARHRSSVPALMPILADSVHPTGQLCGGSDRVTALSLP